MPTSMTGNIDRVEVITSVQRRRRWPAEEKARIVQETSHEGCPVKSACCSFCSRKAYGLAKLRLRMLGQWTEVELRVAPVIIVPCWTLHPNVVPHAIAYGRPFGEVPATPTTPNTPLLSFGLQAAAAYRAPSRSIRLRTVPEYHSPPRAVRTPRAFSASAIA